MGSRSEVGRETTWRSEAGLRAAGRDAMGAREAENDVRATGGPRPEHTRSSMREWKWGTKDKARDPYTLVSGSRFRLVRAKPPPFGRGCAWRVGVRWAGRLACRGSDLPRPS